MSVTLSTLLPDSDRITCDATPYNYTEVILPGNARSVSVQFLDSSGNSVKGRFSFVTPTLAALDDDYWTVWAGADSTFSVEGRSRSNAGAPFSIYIANSAASGIAEVVTTR